MKLNVLQNTALVGDNQSSASTFFLSDPIPIIALPRHSVGALVESKRSVSYALSAMGWDAKINFHNSDVNIIFHYSDINIIFHYADQPFPISISLQGRFWPSLSHWSAAWPVFALDLSHAILKTITQGTLCKSFSIF